MALTFAQLDGDNGFDGSAFKYGGNNTPCNVACRIEAEAARGKAYGYFVTLLDTSDRTRQRTEFGSDVAVIRVEAAAHDVVVTYKRSDKFAGRARIQFFGRPYLKHLPFVHDGNPICDDKRVFLVVRDDDCRAAGGFEDAPNLIAHLLP